MPIAETQTELFTVVESPVKTRTPDSSKLPHGFVPSDYTLVFGNWTFTAALAYAFVIGLPLLAFFYHFIGESWFNNYYKAHLGYYVCSAICQSHYFRAKPTPHFSGILRHVISIACGVAFYYIHEYVFVDILDVEATIPAHFTWIVLAFFAFGFDDTYFEGGLAAWLKKDYLRAVFYYFVSWVWWYICFYSPLIGDGGDSFNATYGNWWNATMQWIIMAEICVAIMWSDYLKTIKSFENKALRGMVTLGASVIFSFFTSSILFCVFHYFFYTEHYEEDSIWHHVLYVGTYPLNALFSFGLYTNKLNDTKLSPLNKSLLRTVIVIFGAIFGYFFFHLVIAPLNVLGEHDWEHHQDLAYNFTVSIVMVTQQWFMSRYGFMVLKKLPPSTLLVHADGSESTSNLIPQEEEMEKMV